MDWPNAVFRPRWVRSLLGMVLVVGSLVGVFFVISFVIFDILTAAVVTVRSPSGARRTGAPQRGCCPDSTQPCIDVNALMEQCHGTDARHGRPVSAVGRPDRSVDVVVRPQGDEEADVTIPAEQDPKVVVDPKRPVVAEVTLQLVGPQERIERIGGAPPAAVRPVAT